MQIRTEFPEGPFTWRQVAARGMPRHRLQAALENREVRRLLIGVYLRSDRPITTLVRAQAAALVISPHAVVCDRTAAWVHGVDAFRYAELDVHPPLETYVLRGHRATNRPECNGGTRDLRASDWTIIGGVRVTTPIRTALDLGCKLSRREAIAVMDALMREHGFTVADLMRELPRYVRRRGVIQLRQLVPLVDGRAESSGESWTRIEIDNRGLPTPVPQHWVNVAGVPTYRLDLAYPHARVAIEYDGEEFHTGPEDRERDARRRGWLRDHGWTVIVLDKRSFTAEAVDAWICELRRALGLLV
jgi:hypothetical protein